MLLVLSVLYPTNAKEIETSDVTVKIVEPGEGEVAHQLGKYSPLYCLACKMLNVV